MLVYWTKGAREKAVAISHRPLCGGHFKAMNDRAGLA
jgi:hypothetical protein